MNFGFGIGGFRVKLHGIGFDAHDRSGVSSKQTMRNLSEHRIGQVLDHQCHAVGFGPAEAQDCSGLCFAGFQGNPRPAKRPSQFNQLPIMAAFIHKQRLAGRDAVNVNGMFFEFIWERLFDVEDFSVDGRILDQQPVENVVDIVGIGDQAVEIGCEPIDVFLV